MFGKKSIVYALLLVAPLAFAELSLDEAKRQGLVGEDASGYVASVSASPSREVRALVKSVNDKRRGEYERLAAENGIDIADMELIAGRKAIDKTESGGYVRRQGSGWEQK